MPLIKKEGSPYVFHGDKDDKHRVAAIKEEEEEEDSDQEELDKFIAEIEDAADKEWEVEEAAEKEEVNRIRYLYKEDYDEEDDDENDENAPGYVYEAPKLERWNAGRNGRFKGREGVEEESCSEDVLDELENVMFESDEENTNLYLKSSSYESESKVKTAKNMDEDWDSD